MLHGGYLKVSAVEMLVLSVEVRALPYESSVKYEHQRRKYTFVVQLLGLPMLLWLPLGLVAFDLQRLAESSLIVRFATHS